MLSFYIKNRELMAKRQESISSDILWLQKKSNTHIKNKHPLFFSKQGMLLFNYFGKY